MSPALQSPCASIGLSLPWTTVRATRRRSRPRATQRAGALRPGPNHSGSCRASRLCMLGWAGHGFPILLNDSDSSFVPCIAPQKANEAAQVEWVKHTVIPPSRLESPSQPPLARLTEQLLLAIMRLKLHPEVVHRRAPFVASMSSSSSWPLP